MTSEAGSQNRFTNGRLFLSNDIFCGCTGIKKPDRYVFRTCPVLVHYVSDPNLQPDGCTVLPMSVPSYSYSVGFSDSATRFTRRVLAYITVDNIIGTEITAYPDTRSCLRSQDNCH